MLITSYIFIFFISIFLCSQSRSIGLFFQVIDKPNKNKIHTKDIPLSGGLIIFILYFVVSAYLFFFLNDISQLKKLIYVSLLFFIGFGDDRYNLKAKDKIFLVTIVSALLIFFDDNFIVEKIYLSNFNSEFYFGKAKIVITIVCILLFFIAKNMADGINGLIISHTLLSILCFSFFLKSFNFDLLSLTLIITLFVTLIYNLNNKLFLGDSGTSLLAGYLIYSLFYENYFFKVDVFLIISPFLIMGIDMVRLFFLRISLKYHPFKKDNKHFHHVLIKNFRTFKSLVIYNFLSFLPLIINQILNINIFPLIGFTVLIYVIILRNYE